MDIAYYICFCPAGTSLEELMSVAGSRWMVEECFQTAKNETGLDPYQVRGYRAWYRHITLSMAALAFLAAPQRGKKRGDPDTVGERPFVPVSMNEASAYSTASPYRLAMPPST
jgi:SRSO17 transposase